jgi:RNA-directed DNA polymerase
MGSGRTGAHDALAEIHHFGSRKYLWVLEGDIEACFDSIDHAALMDRVRRRVGDKRVLTLVKAFCKAGILTELGERQETMTGTPQGGILSPVLANIALSVLDDYFVGEWQATMWDHNARYRRRQKGLANWRLIRYADDWVAMVAGTRADAEQLRQEIATVLAPMGLRLSAHKTKVVHLGEGFDFLGYHIQWRRKRGTNRRHVYTYPSRKALASIKTRLRALTCQKAHPDLKALLTRVNPVARGWCHYFKYGSSSATFGYLNHYLWWRAARWLRNGTAACRGVNCDARYSPMGTASSRTGSSCSNQPALPPCTNAGAATTSRHRGHRQQHHRRHEPVESRMR